jgi:hypothetical protein
MNRVVSPRAFPNSSALAQYRRVAIASGVLAYATKDQRGYGTLDRSCQSGDAYAAVQLQCDNRTMICVASGAIAANTRIYADDNGKVQQSGSVYVGIALTAATADGDEIEVLRTEDPHQKLYTNVAASSAVTNTTAATAFDVSYTILANMLQAGDRLRIRLGGIATATNSTDTLAITLKIGSTTVFATAAVDVADNDCFFIDAELTIRTSGASGTVIGNGVATIKTTATARMLNSTAIDTTATQAITVTATWSVASTSNSCRLDLLSVERLAA